MPVRIYDLAKKLGLESKEVIARARELGITTAKVPSSSLDKITAEYLEEQLGGKKTTPLQPDPPAQAPPPSPVLIVEARAEPAPDAPAPAITSSVVVVVDPAEPQPPLTSPALVVPIVEILAAPPIAEPAAPTPPPAPPPPPPGPKIGEKVGSIKLPVKPGMRPADRAPVPQRPGGPQRPGMPQRQEYGRGRGNTQFVRGQQQPRPAPGPSRLAQPALPQIVTPEGAEVITLKPPIVVRELAEKLNRKPFQLIADLMELKVMATVNQAIDETVAQRICAKYGFKFEVEKRERGGGIVHAPIREVELDTEDKPEDLVPRAPIVTIMGHVDHGKTSLLDVIRKASVAAGEAGGITQHIGAYTISVPHPERKTELQQITFLDTPGHAAFSAMRARGADVTDIVILVVAANDGVMPQTLEALSHAQAAKVPILVAVNKCDHPAANPMRVRQQLQERGLVPDEWGGTTFYVDCSALTKQGIDKLLEMVCFQADLLELRANPKRNAKGNVIESGVAKGGPTATVLVRKGTLHLGDVVICGEHWGKVRALINDEGKRLEEAGPSVAVKLLGLNGVPEAGIEFSAVEDEKNARDLAEQRALEARTRDHESVVPKANIDNIFAKLGAQGSKKLEVVVKADTQGSVEAIVEALKKIEAEKVTLDVIHYAVGTITENDVNLASPSEAVILGFHTRIETSAAEAAKSKGVQIKLYAIIYELIDEVKLAMAGMLDPIMKEVVTGVAEIRKLFELSKGGNIAGCMVTSGRINKGKVRVMRRKNLVYEGLTQSLRRFQDEANEVRAGMECGIRIDGFDEFEIGDTIECYSIEKVAPKL